MKFRLFLSLHLFLLTASLNAAHAYIPGVTEIKDMFDREAAKTVSSITGAARGEAQQFLDFAFSNHINPLLNEIDDMVNLQVNNVDQLIANRLAQVENLIKITMRDVEDRIDQIDRVQKDFIRNVNQLQVDIFKNAHCLVDGTLTRVDNTIDSAYQKIIPGLWRHSWSRYWNIRSCKSSLGMADDPEPHEFRPIYNLYECVVLEELDEDDPVKSVQAQYSSLRVLAQDSICAMMSSPSRIDEEHFAERTRRYETKSALWQWAEDHLN